MHLKSFTGEEDKNFFFTNDMFFDKRVHLCIKREDFLVHFKQFVIRLKKSTVLSLNS